MNNSAQVIASCQHHFPGVKTCLGLSCPPGMGVQMIGTLPVLFIDGCVRPGKPYILMDLGEFHDVRRIQVTTRQQDYQQPVRSFYIHYMSWNYWVPYQVHKKLQVL